MTAASPLPVTLQESRKARRLSQQQLSFRLGVSQRHVSFVETGRAKPSRDLLLAWLGELEVPLRLRNEALLQAGYAPAFGNASLGAAALAVPEEAIDRLLAAHDPMPAFVLDADWQVVRINRGGRWLAATLLPNRPLGPGPINMLDLLIDPEGLTKRMINFGEVGPALLAQLRPESVANPALSPQVLAFEKLLRGRGRVPEPKQLARAGSTPVLTTRYATPHGELAFFSMFTTFGSPQDITLASLRIEHVFAADSHTAQVLRAALSGG